MLTRLEIFRISRGIGARELADEAGYHRSHVLRIRNATTEPSRDAMAALISALRRLSLEDVQPEMVFELTREESGPWNKNAAKLLAREVAAYRREREQTRKVLERLAKQPQTRWLEVVRESMPDLVVPVARAAMIEGHRAIDRAPATAEALFALAIGLADSAGAERPEYRAFLSGRARVERANAFRQLGRFSDALPLLDEAERIFEGIPTCTHELGRAWFVRGSILFKMDGLAEALHYLRLAINIFAALDDQRRVARARSVEANVLFEQGDVVDARARWLSILPVYEAGFDQHSLASLLLNLGWCDLERAAVGEAREWLFRALEGFTKIRSRTDVARARWALALCEARFGDRADGLRALRAACEDLERFQLAVDAGMAALDISEILLLEPGNEREAAAACRGLVALFRRAGAKKEALKALAYLWEAANARTATSQLVRRVRLEIRRAEREPGYVFVSEAVQ